MPVSPTVGDRPPACRSPTDAEVSSPIAAAPDSAPLRGCGSRRRYEGRHQARQGCRGTCWVTPRSSVVSLLVHATVRARRLGASARASMDTGRRGSPASSRCACYQRGSTTGQPRLAVSLAHSDEPGHDAGWIVGVRRLGVLGPSGDRLAQLSADARTRLPAPRSQVDRREALGRDVVGGHVGHGSAPGCG